MVGLCWQKTTKGLSPPVVYFLLLNIYRILMVHVNVSLRERTLCILLLLGNTHVGNYIPAETGCLWFIGAALPAYTYAAIILPDCTIIPGSHRECFFPQCQRTCPFMGSKLARVQTGLSQYGDVGIDFFGGDFSWKGEVF